MKSPGRGREHSPAVQAAKRRRMRAARGKRVVLMGTLDTKGQEVGYVARLIEDRGHEAVIVDCGIMGKPGIAASISRDAVAAAAGTSLDGLLARKDKSFAIRTMSEGAVRIVNALWAEGRLDGIIALGGGQGTIMGTTVMQSLPFGVPKVMVSAVANGLATFGPFVGTRDITILHSVSDVLGLNMITRRVLAEGAGAVCGMVEMVMQEEPAERPTVAMTTAGVTTPCAMKIRDLLESRGYEVIAFHCNGVGAQAMEQLADEGRLAGVIDLSPHDITDLLFGGIFPAWPERMRATSRRGVPQLIVPGAADFILFGPVQSVPRDMLARKHNIHNPLHTHVRATREEMRAVGRFVAERLCEGSGPAAVLVPAGGFTQLNVAGGVMYDPESDSGFLEGLEDELARHPARRVPVRSLDLHINDPCFAEAAAGWIDEMIRGCDG